MKYRPARIPSKCSKPKKKHGFALIATLTLMMLLTLLAVGIMAIIATQNRVAMQSALQSEARQQALIGLDAAIGALQMELGPDQRITADSSILSEKDDGGNNPHLLGVWNSWDGPIYGKSASGKGEKIAETYDQGRSKMFRRWLISTTNETEVTSLKAASSLGKRQRGKRICLVGEGTLGRRYRENHYVYADLLTMPAAGNNTGCFAWWIGGENLKCKVSIQDPEATTDPVELLHRTWDTPAPIIADNQNLDFLPSEIKEPGKLLTMASLPLLDSSAQDAGMPYFFDVTLYSYSLPVNVRDGGLKTDLCLLLNKKTLEDTEFARRANQDCPIAENDELPKGSEKYMPIGSWQNMHAYYNCWPDGTGTDDNMGCRLVGSVEKNYTRMAGGIGNTGEGGESSSYDSRADFAKGIGYARTPVMLAFMNNFGLVVDPFEGKVTTDTKEPVYKLRMCFSPFVLWWNPYNVPMKIKGNKLWAQSVPYKSMWLQTYTKNWDWSYYWGTYAMQQRTDGAGFGQDWGNYFQVTADDKDSDLEFGPGEILFFSPGVARLTEEYTLPLSNPWALGYNPTSVAGYKAHFYGVNGVHDGNDVTSAYNIDNKRFRVGIRLGLESEGGQYNSDGYWFVPNRREAITIYSGYNGINGTSAASGSIGKQGESPQRGLLGWYDPSAADLPTELGNDYWSTEGQSDPRAPYFITSVGFAAKSANPTLDSHLFPNRDFRTKAWQHSSPALWGSMIINPSDQERQYHPYQFAALDVGAALSSCPMDNIGRNGMLGITSEGEQVSFAAVSELPVHPPFSLAGFAGMRLQPGWYKSGSDTKASMRRMQYQSGVPGVGIGNSFADPCLPAGGVYAFYRDSKIPTEVTGNGSVFGDFYDHGLLINDALWDSWFCSSISDMPGKGGKKEAKEVFASFLSGQSPLPVSRYKRTKTPYRNEDILKRVINEPDGWKYIAQYLMIDGGFNVNSTSEDAWYSVLMGLSKRKLVSNVNEGRLTEVEKSKKSDDVLFSRFMVSTTDKSLDSLGGYSAMQGSTALRSAGGELAAWGEVRKLESEQVRELAKEMVKQVRLRGPFLNMSDFINRRLDSSGKETALKGALQAAIDATGINEDFMEQRATPAKEGSLYKFPKAEEGSIYTAAPGYLIQSDVLASLGNILTLRDDTFTVRAYGCVRSPSNGILAQAWCEAIMQRTIDYVDSNNVPSDTDAQTSTSSRGKATPLSELNRVMGRRFRLVSFKWLDAWDI